MDKMGSSIKLIEFIESDQFCNGKVSVVAYNTGWVARIKDRSNPDKPAFPRSLEWLRNNQLSDGSWGSTYPILIFERIVSTLIAIVCLKQWKSEKDLPLIESGSKYIRHNLNKLAHLKELQDKMTIGFELIFPSLVDEAKSLGIHFGQEQIIEVYRKERERKLNKIYICEKNDIKCSGPKSWYFTLEALGALYSDQEITNMVSKENELICCSYAATAFALLRGLNLERSLEYLSKVSLGNNGGIPSLYKVEVFDLAWSLNSLVFAGYKLNHVNLRNSIQRLKKIWDDSKGMVGACVGLPPDADDIANTLFVLSTTQRIYGIKSVESLLKFFKNNYFITFEGEKQPSLSTNINCLIALNNFQHYSEIKKITYKVYEWTRSKFIENSFKFEDKWHFSSYYPISRALFAFYYIDKDMSETIYQMLLDQQNEDGGWGTDGRSSFLESSYAIISIIYWVKNQTFCSKQKGIDVLKKGKLFMDNYNDDDQIPFWIDKALYSPINVDKTSILAAKFALDEILK